MLAFSLRDAREVNRFTTSQLKLRVVNRMPRSLLRGSSLVYSRSRFWVKPYINDIYKYPPSKVTTCPVR